MKNVFRDICFRNTENTLYPCMTGAATSCVTARHGETVSSVVQPGKMHRCGLFGGISRG